jgi:hypothetical protein
MAIPALAPVFRPIEGGVGVSGIVTLVEEGILVKLRGEAGVARVCNRYMISRVSYYLSVRAHILTLVGLGELVVDTKSVDWKRTCTANALMAPSFVYV